MSNIEKRLAELEKGLKAADKKTKAAEERAASLEAKLEQAERDRKRTAAQLHEVKVQARAEVGRLQSMRDLASGPNNPYEQDSRDRYEELKRSTVKTKDGRRHYYAESPCFISDNGKPPFVYHPRESFVSLPADVDPSVTWKAVKVAGKDKNGNLVFVPIETDLDGPKEVDPRQEVAEDPSAGLPTNTELNAKAAKGRVAAAQRGAGAPPPKPTPPAPGAGEVEGDGQGEGEASTEAEGEGAPEGARPSDTEVG